MEVRRAKRDDAADVVRLIMLFFEAEGFTTPAAVVAERAVVFLEDGAGAAFLAIDGDHAIGIATVSTSFGFEGGRLAEIEDLYVIPSHRGHGVATALLGEAMLWSRREGFETLRVIVTPEDEERRQQLIRWYGRLGYVDTNRSVLHFGSAGSLS